MAEFLELAYLPPPPPSAPLCSLQPVHTISILCLAPIALSPVLGWLSQNSPCIAVGMYDLMLVFPGVLCVVLCVGSLGPMIAQLSAVLALPLLPLCCHHPSSFKSDLVSSVSPTMLLGEHTYGLSLLPHFMK